MASTNSIVEIVSWIKDSANHSHSMEQIVATSLLLYSCLLLGGELNKHSSLPLSDRQLFIAFFWNSHV